MQRTSLWNGLRNLETIPIAPIPAAPIAATIPSLSGGKRSGWGARLPLIPGVQSGYAAMILQATIGGNGPINPGSIGVGPEQSLEQFEDRCEKVP